MALKIVWSVEAEQGLDEIIDYLENHWTEEEIIRFFRRLEACLEQIKEAPNRQKDSLRKPGTKEYQHSSQTTIFYTFDDQAVNILRVWTNVKNPDSL